MYGLERLRKDLESMNYAVEVIVGSDNQSYTVIRKYEIGFGRFAGREIDLGIMAIANYPQAVPAAIQVRANPQLIEIGHVPNVRNIQASPLGSEWLYWSKNFNWDVERSTRRLISQINTIFKDA